MPPDEWTGRMLYRHVVKAGRRARFISLVREPIDRNISAFFQNLERFVGMTHEEADFTIDELIGTFLKRYPHSVPLTWFDLEVKTVLDIDVYDHQFPREKGWLRIENGPFALLVIKLEIDDRRKQSAIAQFLGMDEFELVRANVAEEKEYGQTYRDFLERITLPSSYVDIMCSAEYTTQFYSAAEIEAVRRRWRDRVNPTELPPSVYRELAQASHRSINWP
jgi:hypothetical protein